MRNEAPRVVLILALTMAAGCSEPRQSSPAPAVSGMRAQAAQADFQPAAGAAEAKAPTQQAASSALAAQAAARKLIRTAQLGIEVGDYAEAAKQAEALVERLGGYVADSQTTRGTHDRRYGALTARVPAEQFKAALASLRGLGKVLSENVATQDVTKAYTDVETRLGVKRATAARLQDILRGKTARLSDILDVERELARVTEETEALEGERRFYDQQISLSSIVVNLSEPDAVVSASAFEPIVAALHNSLQVLSVSVAVIIAAVVFLAPWVPLIWLAWRVIGWLRARRRGRPQPAS
jgi:hypothetical protein